MFTKSEEKMIGINSEVSLSMFKKVRLPNISRNIVNLYVCFEITFSKKKWVNFSIYRPPTVENLTGFLEEMTTSLTKMSSSSENNLFIGDFNIDIKRKAVGSNNLSDFCDLFHLANTVKFDTCFTKTHTSLTDLTLTNKPSSFNNTTVASICHLKTVLQHIQTKLNLRFIPFSPA